MSDWQPIETAPKDGTRVLFWLADEGFPCLASWRKWDGYEGFFLWDMGDFADHNLPSHWMALPHPPEDAR